MGIGLSGGVWPKGSGRKTEGGGGRGNFGCSCPRLSSAETTSVAGPAAAAASVASCFILLAAGGVVVASWSAWSFKNFFQWRTGGDFCGSSSLLFFFLDTTRESGWSLEDEESTEETEDVGDTCNVSSESVKDGK